MITTTKAMQTSVIDLTDVELLAAWDYVSEAADRLHKRMQRNGPTNRDELQMRILEIRLTAIATETARRNLIDNEG